MDDFTKPKLLKSKKKDGSYDWFVLYRYRNPETGKMDAFKSRKGINYLKTDREKKSFGADEVLRLYTRLKGGWSPFAIPTEKDKNKEDFYWWFEQRLSYSKQMHGFYNYRKLLSVYNKLKEFSPVLAVRDFNVSFLKKYEVHLKTVCENTVNTISDNMMRISIIMREVENDGEIERKNNPFRKIKFDTERVVKDRLDEKQLSDFEKANLKKKPLCELARDMYLLSYYCAGIRFGDLARLKPEMFEGGRLIYQMHKTGKKKRERNIVLVAQAKRIVNKYKGSEYLFPLNIDWNNEEQSINSENTRMNKHLKKACKLAEIPEMTFHTSRNSFADRAVRKGASTRDLKEAFGHSTERVTEVYTADFYPEQTDRTMKDIFKK